MTRLEWHNDDPTVASVPMLDRDPADDEIDLAAVRSYRLERVRTEMERYAVDACLLFDPVNIRYATDSRNMQIFTSRNPARYLFRLSTDRSSSTSSPVANIWPLTSRPSTRSGRQRRPATWPRAMPSLSANETGLARQRR